MFSSQPHHQRKRCSPAIGGLPKNIPHPRPLEQPPHQQPHSNPKPNNNKPQDAPHIDPAPAHAQAQLNNVYGLNRRLDQAENFLDALDIGQSIAEALLATAQTTTASGSPTVNNSTAFATSFAPCKSYASILTSCASATASFYDLDYDQKAACVCYQASTNTDSCQAIPTLDLSYDDYEFMCYDFLGTIQASFITEAMDEATMLPGPLLCSWAVSQTDFIMSPTLSPTTVSCASPTSTSPASPQSTNRGGDAVRLLTASDRNILAAFALLIIAFSGLIIL